MLRNRIIPVVFAIGIALSTALCGTAHATTKPEPAPTPNVILTWTHYQNPSTGAWKTSLACEAYTAPSNQWGPAKDCGHYVTITRHGKPYLKLKLAKGLTFVTGNEYYMYPGGSVQQTWQGKPQRRHWVDTINGKKVHTMLGELSASALNPDQPSQPSCTTNCK